MTTQDPRIRPIAASNLPAELSLHEGAQLASDLDDMELCGLCEDDALLNEPIVGKFKVDASHKPLPSPKGMTFTEWELHRITHLPYSSSCSRCIAGKRNNSHHRRSQNQAHPSCCQ